MGAKYTPLVPLIQVGTQAIDWLIMTSDEPRPFGEIDFECELFNKSKTTH